MTLSFNIVTLLLLRNGTYKSVFINAPWSVCKIHASSWHEKIKIPLLGDIKFYPKKECALMSQDHIYLQIKKYLLYLVTQNQRDPLFLLPSEKQLSLRFGCSRIPAKRALEELKAEGVIYRVQGRGSFIRMPNHTSPAHYARKSVCILLPNSQFLFIRKIMLGLEECFAEKNITPFFTVTGDMADIEARLVDSAVGKLFDGMIIFPVVYEAYNKMLLNLITKKYPLLFIARNNISQNASSVCCDDFMMLKNTMEYLISQNHRQIGYIAESSAATEGYAERIRAYRQYIAKIPNGKPQLCEINFFKQRDSENEHQNTRGLISVFLKENPGLTAIILSNMALRDLEQCLREQQIPTENITLVVIDYPEDPLPTGFQDVLIIDQNPYLMGYQAAQQITEQILHSSPPKQTILESRLIRGDGSAVKASRQETALTETG